ncbi:hypothetical protein [Silanimonas sp.]|uniref:hypothetical protein n=1 Tax=Silanimonas sp. TaxID=1929290 RepID=UPI0037CB0A77
MSAPRSLASRLTTRLFVIAAAALVVNMLAVGLYYGFDRRAMEGEVVEHRLGLVAEAFDSASGRVDASARALYEAHPEAYAFVVADADGRVLDAANPGLVPRRAFEEAAFADDWLAHRKSGSRSLLIASKKSTLGGRELRLVFVMREDPAHLLPRALLAEFVGHIWLPIVPVVVLLIAANAVLIRRGLAPVTAAARWARSVRPGHAPAPLPAGDLPSEIVDLVDATRRSLDRLNDALSAEKRRAAEAAHALRTPGGGAGRATRRAAAGARHRPASRRRGRAVAHGAPGARLGERRCAAGRRVRARGPWRGGLARGRRAGRVRSVARCRTGPRAAARADRRRG